MGEPELGGVSNTMIRVQHAHSSLNPREAGRIGVQQRLVARRPRRSRRECDSWKQDNLGTCPDRRIFPASRAVLVQYSRRGKPGRCIVLAYHSDVDVLKPSSRHSRTASRDKISPEGRPAELICRRVCDMVLARM